MNRRGTTLFGAALCVTGVLAGSLPAFAQVTFQTYRCVDGSQFIVAFYKYDKRAHVQIDGKSLALGKRLGLSGANYSGGGVRLKITRTGATVRHARRPLTACEPAI
jgi:membrane-bound inhibitor of C-type lysozyme